MVELWLSCCMCDGYRRMREAVVSASQAVGELLVTTVVGEGGASVHARGVRHMPVARR